MHSCLGGLVYITVVLLSFTGGFSDFKHAPPTIPTASSSSDLIGQGDKYDALRTELPGTCSRQQQHMSHWLVSTAYVYFISLILL